MEQLICRAMREGGQDGARQNNERYASTLFESIRIWQQLERRVVHRRCIIDRVIVASCRS